MMALDDTSVQNEMQRRNNFGDPGNLGKLSVAAKIKV